MIITTDKELRARDPFDHYPTPIPLCQAALDLLPQGTSPRLVLDPGAGQGPWGVAARERWSHAHILGIEARALPEPAAYSLWLPSFSFVPVPTPKEPKGPFKSEKHEADRRALYEAELEISRLPVWQSPYDDPSFDLVIGNPPYKLAEPFVWRSLSLLKPGGHLVFLLRLAFLEGQERGESFWPVIPPRQVAVCSRRPSFTGNAKTDSTAYAVFIWQKGWQGTPALNWITFDYWETATSLGVPEQLALFAA